MKSILIKEVQESDLVPLGEFLVRGFPGVTQEEWYRRFDTFWTHNPTFEEAASPRGWILEDKSHLLGFIGCIPVKFLINGIEAFAMVSSSWYVEPTFRGINSIQLFSSFHSCSNTSLFLSTTPHPIIRPILDRFQYSHLQIPFNRTEYLYFVDYLKSFRLLFKDRRMSQQSSSSTNLTKKGIEFPPIPNLKARISFQTSENLVCSIASSFDASFEDLWRSTAPSHPYQAELCRDVKTMNWLCFSDAILPKKRLTIQCRDTSNLSLMGYMVFDIEEPYQASNLVFRMMDAFVPEYKEEVIREIIRYVIELATEKEASFIIFTAWDPRVEAFFNKTFKFRRFTDNVYYFRFTKSASVLPYDAKPPLCPSSIYPDRSFI